MIKKIELFLEPFERLFKHRSVSTPRITTGERRITTPPKPLHKTHSIALGDSFLRLVHHHDREQQCVRYLARRERIAMASDARDRPLKAPDARPPRRWPPASPRSAPALRNG
ncbi:hypothetical protein GGD83_004737 [Rhodoblastus sphagnicola]|uniref:hypothetical protein n=1 Tax=Rhodoblastus sphagnicola TaxID=333368 RepID=UPI000CECAFEA|nr:hypothetical protein [Rhodoblastus sphagnicola]MBB4200908.1 hypothetical protein [Rhodoblastus sphagnicola]